MLMAFSNVWSCVRTRGSNRNFSDIYLMVTVMHNLMFIEIKCLIHNSIRFCILLVFFYVEFGAYDTACFSKEIYIEYVLGKKIQRHMNLCILNSMDVFRGKEKYLPSEICLHLRYIHKLRVLRRKCFKGQKKWFKSLLSNIFYMSCIWLNIMIRKLSINR